MPHPAPANDNRRPPVGLPLWHVAPDRAGLIRRGDVGLAWAMVLAVVPALAMLLHAGIVAVAGYAPFTYPDGALRGDPAALLILLAAAPALFLPLAILTLPLLRPLARAGLAGLAVPPLAALLWLGFLALFAAADGAADAEGVPDLARAGPAGAVLLGLAFWAVLRLRRPEAFRPGRVRPPPA